MTGTHAELDEREIKRQVREFYDRVGWKEVSDGLYQNARYEDLRPVSQGYIHRCHLRVKRHLTPSGRLLLDAGSGPIQYPEYVEYSRGYQRRVCADISITALQAARQRIGEHGAFVVADVSRLPFASDAFDGAVSLHTIHHVPAAQQTGAYEDLYRVLAPGGRAAVVNGWGHSPLDTFFERLMNYLKRSKGATPVADALPEEKTLGRGTFVKKWGPRELRSALRGRVPFRIFVWRTASTNFLRFYIREEWFGRFWLKVLYALEELFPRFFGEFGRYPLIVIRKPAG